MIVVSNTTPLIGLASIGRFELLRLLFGKIYIPKAVYHEAVIQGREEGGARREVLAADWIEVVEVQDQLAVEVLLDELDRGEAEVIVLAADWVFGRAKRTTKTEPVGNAEDRHTVNTAEGSISCP